MTCRCDTASLHGIRCDDKIYQRLRAIVEESLRSELLALFDSYVRERDTELTNAIDEHFRHEVEETLKRNADLHLHAKD